MKTPKHIITSNASAFPRIRFEKNTQLTGFAGIQIFATLFSSLENHLYETNYSLRTADSPVDAVQASIAASEALPEHPLGKEGEEWFIKKHGRYPYTERYPNNDELDDKKAT